MATPITLIDGPNWFRRRAETDVFGTPVKTCFYEIQNRPGLIIVVWDGFGALERRRFLYPDYKVRRTPAPESIYESQKVLKKILTFSKSIQVTCDGYEGDDTIAALAARYKGQQVFIESNDLDLYQLGCPMARSNFPDKPENIQLYKSMVGDPSDNIPGCKNFGKGAWAALTDSHKRTLESIIVSGWGLTADDVRRQVGDWFPNRALNWFVEKENRKTLLLYYKIVGFIPVPWPMIEQNLKQGKNRPDLAGNILKEFLI